MPAMQTRMLGRANAYNRIGAKRSEWLRAALDFEACLSVGRDLALRRIGREPRADRHYGSQSVAGKG